MTQMSELLRRIDATEITGARRSAVDSTVVEAAGRIVEDVRLGGADSVARFAQEFGERKVGEPLILDRELCNAALESVESSMRSALEGAAERIGRFAAAQRDALAPITIPIDGGTAGHDIVPIESAACYAPGGRYPLPSSVLMTAVTARVAGCKRVVVVSPGGHPVCLAAAAIAGADCVLAAGGAHGIAACAFGFDGFPACDVIAGPGNKWVTAAKSLVSRFVGIDMLAGPSELLVIADSSADPDLVAADLLAQAEHDPDAVPMLVSTCETVVERVEISLRAQLATLATSEIARAALQNGFVCVVESMEEAVRISNRIGPEHLEIITRRAREVLSSITNAGAVFVGGLSAEVFGDYGAGPNHTLPTGGTARFRGGLSVLDFLRVRTWIDIRDRTGVSPIVEQAERLATLEGLEGHARAARMRCKV